MRTLEVEYRERRESVLVPLAERLREFLESCLRDEPRIDRIVTRAKGVNSFLAKAKAQIAGQPKYTDPLSQIQDQIGARIVTFYTADVPRLAKAVETYLRPIEQRLVIPESDSEFGYFGKHYIMLLPKDVKIEPTDETPLWFELQIKTLFQHAWSEANHDLGYKPGSTLSPDQRRKLAFTAAQAWGADMIFDELHEEMTVELSVLIDNSKVESN